LASILTSNSDFPFGLLPATSVDIARDFLPWQQICKSFFQSRLGFPPPSKFLDAFFSLQMTIFRQWRSTFAPVL
jgi:hypothetical protein